MRAAVAQTISPLSLYLQIQRELGVDQQQGERGKHRLEGWMVDVGGDGGVDLMGEGPDRVDSMNKMYACIL